MDKAHGNVRTLIAREATAMTQEERFQYETMQSGQTLLGGRWFSVSG